MSVPTDPSPGVLADRYEAAEAIGAGGMARVYRGRDRILQRPVAIKVLDASLAEDERFLRGFVREAQAAAPLIHPNIVTVFDTGVDEDRHFIVMELVEGATLREFLRREQRLDPERARRIAADVAEALAAAHARGIVHHDVKPGNVLMGEDGRPRVADFGIARASEQPGETRMVLGTAAYLSPEQARGLPTTPASDVYSLGCVLYEMLAGRPPFTGENPVQVAAKHLRHAPQPIEAVNPATPPALAAIVGRAMEKDPGRRFADAGEMLAALRGAATSLPAPARRRRRIRPRWLAAALAAAVVVLLPAMAGPDPTAAVDAPKAGGEPAATAEMEVPSVVGMIEGEAGRTLRRAGFVPVFEGAALGDGIEQVVASQRPRPGTARAAGSFVTLVLVASDPASPPATSSSGSGSSDDGAAPETPATTQRQGEKARSSGENDDRAGPSPSPSPDPTPSPTPTSSPSPTPTPTPTPTPSPTPTA